MIIKEKNNNGYVFETEDGATFFLKSHEISSLKALLDRESLTEDIRYIVEQCDGDTISLGSLDMTVDEFIEEVLDYLDRYTVPDHVPTDEDIERVVLETADQYGIMIG